MGERHVTDLRLILALLALAGLAACGGRSVTVDCDGAQYYQRYVDGNRVVAPQGLDPLDEFAEMPIPKADPEAAPPPPGRCLDMPPTVGT
jgi:hypothetical protein